MWFRYDQNVNARKGEVDYIVINYTYKGINNLVHVKFDNSM